MTYEKTHPMPRVLVDQVDARGITWVWCEDCSQHLPATRRHGGPPRVIPHLRHRQMVGRSHLSWPRHQRDSRRRVWRCLAGGRCGVVQAPPESVADVCADCPLAVLARDGWELVAGWWRVRAAREPETAPVVAAPVVAVPRPTPPGELEGQLDLYAGIEAA